MHTELLTRLQAAVAQPKTAEETSAIVKFATANNIAFNVKGGGHSTSQTSSAPSPDGMVLDLSLMRSVSVDTEAQTVTFGGGCLWGDVDDALWPHGLATPGGTVSHTGVGGLILHGGYGQLSGIHGLTIDVLQACQVVLADGSIVTASASENADLFWALRGAGSSFGVVTEFTSKAFPQGDIWAGMIMYAPDKLPALVDFINTWAATNDGTQAMGLGFGHAPPVPESDPPMLPPVIIIQLLQAGPEPEKTGPEFFKPLLELESLMQHVGQAPYPLANKGADDTIFASGRRYLFGGSNFTAPLKLSTAEAIRDKFWGFGQSKPGAGLEASVCLLECIPNGKSRTVPTDSMSFNSRGDYFNVGVVWSWADEALDQEVREYNRKFQDETRGLGYNDEGMRDGVGRYLNYISTGALNAEDAFGSNAAKLRELKAKYDPGNVFDKLWKLIGKVEEQWAM